MNEKLNSAWWALRVGLGLGAFLAGLDKFFNILTDWGMYLSPLAERMLPVSGVVFMRAVGVIEMAAGLVILTGFARIGGYIVMGWLVAIAVNLVITGMFFDLAVRDVEIAIAAYTLARLTEVRQVAGAREGTFGEGKSVIDADGTYLKLDAAGNEQTVAALKATKKTDHLRATVIGERDGTTIKVTSVSIE